MNGSKGRGYKKRTLSARIVIVIMSINAQGCRSIVGAVPLDLPSRPVGVLAIISCLHVTIAVGGTGLKYSTLYILRKL